MARQIRPEPPSRRNSEPSLWPSGGAFAVLVLAVAASWQIRSAFTVGLVAFLAVILYALAEFDVPSVRRRSRNPSGIEREESIREPETAAVSPAGAKLPHNEPAVQQTGDAEEAGDGTKPTEGDGRQETEQLEGDGAPNNQPPPIA